MCDRILQGDLGTKYMYLFSIIYMYLQSVSIEPCTLWYEVLFYIQPVYREEKHYYE